MKTKFLIFFLIISFPLFAITAFIDEQLKPIRTKNGLIYTKVSGIATILWSTKIFYLSKLNKPFDEHRHPHNAILVIESSDIKKIIKIINHLIISSKKGQTKQEIERVEDNFYIGYMKSTNEKVFWYIKINTETLFLENINEVKTLFEDAREKMKTHNIILDIFKIIFFSTILLILLISLIFFNYKNYKKIKDKKQ